MFSAVLQLDFHIWRRYKFQVFTEIFHAVVLLSIFYFLSEAIGKTEVFRGEYFPYFVIGITFSRFYSGLCSGAVGTLRDWQYQGVLESIFVAPVARWKILLFAGLPGSIVDVAKAVLFIAISVLVFGVNFPKFQILPVIATVFLTVWLCQLLSLVSVASVLLWKRVNLVALTSSLGTLLLSGIYFPVNVLPDLLQKIAFLIPFTHAVNLLRWGFMNEAFDFSVTTSFLMLFGWCALLSVGSFYFFQYAERKLAANGKLSSF